MTLLRCLQVEILKLKRTLALAMVVIAPTVVVMLQMILYLARSDQFLVEDVNPWQLMQSSLGLWSVLMLPLFVTLETALLAGLEHNNGQWKHLHALPVPRGSIYTAKLLIGVGLIGVANLILGVGVQLGGFVLRFIGPEMAAGPMLWDELGRLLGFSFVASLLTVSIHTWISLRWASFTVAVASGMTATVIGFVAANSERLVGFYPWTLPINALRDGTALAPIAIYSVVAAAAVGVAGCVNMVRRDVTA